MARARRHIGRWLPVLLTVSLLLPAGSFSLGRGSAAAVDAHAVYYPETGFWVADPFLSFWEQHGGLITFGYPISRVFYQDGLLRQYFERAIFERHDEYAETPYQVLLTRIGALNTVDRRGELSFQSLAGPEDPGCDFFPETGHQLCGHFRDYWQERGGLPSLGYSLSEVFDEGGRTVQYFERARLEDHPENAAPFDVLLGHLGREALRARLVPPEAVAPESPSVGPAAPLGPRPLYPDRAISCGFNLLWWGDLDHLSTNQYYLQRAAESGCGWIRMQIQWSQVEYEPYRYAWYPVDVFVDAARARGLRILATVNSPPGWARTGDARQPADPVVFGDFIGELATHFKGRVDAWQLWNEPNLVVETAGRIDVPGYFAMVKVAGPRVRQSDPAATIVLAGLAPNSLNDPTLAVDDIAYLTDLFAINGGEIRRYIDVVGIHSYGAGNPPDSYWPSNLNQAPGWNTAPEFYFRHAEAIHQVLIYAGAGDLPLWLTEFGWTTRNASPVYGYGDWISPDDQARYLTRAFEIARTEWPWLERMFVFSLNTAALGGNDGPYFGFSVLDADGQPRPAYDAIRLMPKGLVIPSSKLSLAGSYG